MMKKIAFFFSLLFLPIFGFDATIPVLNLQDYFHEETRDEFLSQLQYACEEVGFFALTETGIDQGILDNAYREVESFFEQDFKVKNQYDGAHTDYQRGFVPGESAKGETRVDFKEFYHIGRETIPNIWPKEQPSFKPSMLALYHEMEKYSQILDEAFAKLLHLDDDFFQKMTLEGEELMRVSYYPANPPKDAIWGGAHTDINLYTILPRATAKGLQIKKKNGEWIDVIVPDDAFIINIADMLENLTNGLFRSSVHRVMDPGLGEKRLSMVYFVHPRSEDDMSPLLDCIEKTGGIRRYPNVTRLDLLQERLIDLGLASREMMEEFVSNGSVEKFQEVGRASPDALKTLQEEGLIH